MTRSVGDDQPLPLRELARRVGIAESTLRSWEKLPDRPLRTTRGQGRSVTATAADVRAFCAEHHERHGARRVAAHLDNPTAAVDTATVDVDSLRTVLEAVITVVRATAEAHVELADTTARSHHDHAATLTGALRTLDATLNRLVPDDGPREAVAR